MSFTFLDLFSGAGGFSLGLNEAGGAGDSIAIDLDPDCAETLGRNLPDSRVITSDVRDVDYTGISVDVLVAGPPCQGFSRLNRGRASDERRMLWIEVVRAVETVRPKIVVVENVAGFATSVEGEGLRSALEQHDFATRLEVVNAADFGVPQLRKRSILCASTAGMRIPWPTPTHAPDGDGLPHHRTVAEAFSLLPTSPNDIAWHRDVFGGRETHQERVRVVPEGGARKDLPADLVLDCWKETEGFADVMGRLSWHKPASTVRTEFFRPEKGRFLHPSEDRPITPREAARLQSFPDTFEFPDHHGVTSVGRQVGNAMPPRLARAIGTAIRWSIGGMDSIGSVQRRDSTT